MSTIMPKGEKLRNAVKWISEKLKEEPNRTPQQMIPLASERFNLSPKEENFLVSFYGENKGREKHG
ncbi:MAG: hypothetical protein DRH12_05150 [Deltaproteobacteria bacterium]|nr:MAG: hypothetical protein DRH12_05150 [Deltaproteobacteria bacterium]